MKNIYEKPIMTSSDSHILRESIGPVQNAYVEFHYKQTGTGRGAFYQELKDNSVKIVKAKIVNDSIEIG
jgi:hypothetical protein